MQTGMFRNFESSKLFRIGYSSINRRVASIKSRFDEDRGIIMNTKGLNHLSKCEPGLPFSVPIY